jgi:hypothetical protein
MSPTCVTSQTLVPINFLFEIKYGTKNYWVFGLCPLSSILKTRKHNVSETGSVSVLR